MLNEDYINQIDIKNFKIKIHVKKVEIVILSLIGEAVKKKANFSLKNSIYNYE